MRHGSISKTFMGMIIEEAFPTRMEEI